ncbi:hypothetical protein I203_108333 [Kwoniella mangroviensis CBS 8507]|uniref:hypothetical protein n=1 Tax=Kwoniella mangroviensis CBS 8507 TaxID=1296122 RepID=UPI00080D6381|nr:uncharacterized protein I203_05225 [Kwoniella mangroviensis CBS 8507]OCF65550.1 hypothetical protein I203_05225 [Kwoniella mangroviensis CBS 8507]
MESKISLNDNPPPPYQSTVSLNSLTHLPPYQASTSTYRLSQSVTSDKKSRDYSWIHNDEIWSNLIPFLPPSTLSALSRTCKSVYHHVIPHLWKVYRIKSDDQLWTLLHLLAMEHKNRQKGWFSKGKGKLSIFNRSNRPSSLSLENSRLRIQSLSNMIVLTIFDIIPSPSICVLIPIYISRSSNLISIVEEKDTVEDEGEGESGQVLFLNVDQIHFSPKLIKEVVNSRFGWRMLRKNDYEYHLHLPDDIKGKMPNKYNIHIILPITFDLATEDIDQFLKGRNHFIHLPKEWFNISSTFAPSSYNQGKYEDESEDEDQDESEDDDNNERSTFIRHLTHFLEEIIHADALMNHHCVSKMDHDHYRLDCRTKWIVRYPHVGQGVIEEVKNNLLDMVNRGKFERLARDGIFVVDQDEESRVDFKDNKKIGGIGVYSMTKKGESGGNVKSKVELWFMRLENNKCLVSNHTK